MTLKTNQLESIGHLCASLQSPHVRVRGAIDALKLKPAVVINGIPHYDGRQCERIADKIQLNEKR